jgi:membrane-associated phospholipid phosphatase
MSETGDGHPRGGGGASGARLAWLCWWPALTVLWLALADSRRAEEIVTGLVVGAVGATAAVLVRTERATVLRPRPRWALAALAPLRDWPRDLVALGGALVRRPRGRIVEEPFAATGDDPRDAARQALAEASGSLAPNRIVIGIDAERCVIVSHVLVDDERRS